MEKIALTSYAAKGGCACKLGPHLLAKALLNMPSNHQEDVLVDMQAADDAGIYRINSELALVQTLDFFTPLVDDPFIFGQIAAANSLSDVYAMGGRPITALNILAFPISLVEAGALQEVFRGANQVLQRAGVALLGGHSVENETPLFGLSVTGQVHPERFWSNGGAQVGDALILTKPLGTGLMTTALKGELFERGCQEALDSMVQLNDIASQVGHDFTIHACTDVTGFSLMGHGREMADASQVSLQIDSQSLPLFHQVLEAAEMGLVPAATYGNRKALLEGESPSVYLEPYLNGAWSDICFDPQTSGGLLFAVPHQEAEAMLDMLVKQGLIKARRIGKVIEKSQYSVYVR